MTKERIRDICGNSISDKQINKIFKTLNNPILEKKLREGFKDLIMLGREEIKIDKDEFK